MEEKVSSSNCTDTTDMSELFAQLEARKHERKQQMIERINRVISLDEATDLIDGASTEVQDLLFRRIISGQISGDADDFHNASISFSRCHQYQKAAEVCRKGLEKWPSDIDLNADLLTYLMDAGNIKEASIQAEHLELNCPDRNKWNWRAFRFYFDYLMEACPNNYEDKAKELIEDYKRALPWDEKAYRCEADLYERKGEIHGAIKTLEDCVSKFSAPQCALRLADIYFERAQYDDVIRVSTLGIAYAAEPQPGIRTAYLLFLRALSKDALFLIKSDYSSEEAEKIIGEYKLALKYVSPREKDVIRQRIDILQVYSGSKEGIEDDS